MNNHYSRFLLMIISMFITMYVLMYVVVGGHSNVNQFQMTVLMTAPMVVIEIILMNELYRNRRLNRTIIILSLVFTIGCWLLIREQTTIVEILFRNSEATPHSLTSHGIGVSVGSGIGVDGFIRPAARGNERGGERQCDDNDVSGSHSVSPLCQC